MAVVQFGGGVAGMRGSSGGSTYTRTKAGAIQRARVKGTQPNTIFQSDQKSIISELSTAWGQTLTQAERDGWRDFGVAFPSVNKIGETVLLSGNQAFMRAGAALVAAGESYLSAAPANQDVAELQSLALTADIGAGNFEVAFTNTGDKSADLFIGTMTAGLSPGISNIGSKLRRTITSAADPSSPVDLSAAYALRFGGLPLVGQKVVIRGYFLRPANGATSSYLESSAIVVSTV